MATAYGLGRCTATSWRGSGPAPERNQCIEYADHPHAVHRDSCGNNFDDAGQVVVIRNSNKPRKGATR